MSGKQTFSQKHNQQPCYETRHKGQLDDRWAESFEGLTITLEENGDTVLSGPLADQAALHGILKKVRDLGPTLLSVRSGEPDTKEGRKTSISTYSHSYQAGSIKTSRSDDFKKKEE